MWKMSVIHRNSTTPKITRAFFSWKENPPMALCCCSTSARPPSTLGSWSSGAMGKMNFLPTNHMISMVRMAMGAPAIIQSM